MIFPSENPRVCRESPDRAGKACSACHAEGRGFESLQPLSKREKACICRPFSYVQSAGAFASPGTHWAPAARPAAPGASKAVNFGFFAGSLLVTRTTDLLRDARLQFFDRLAVADRALPDASALGPPNPGAALPLPHAQRASRSPGSARPPWTNRGVSRRPMRPRASLASVEKEESRPALLLVRGGGVLPSAPITPGLP